MALRCLLFSSDEQSAEPIRHVLANLGVEGEHCAEAMAAVEAVTHLLFHIVIVDWDKQPEAGLLLTAARERKAGERPLTLAIVSDDASVAKVLQAGANSVLRKPILASQVTDTLTTARDLLRAKENAATAAQAAAAGASAAGTSTVIPALPASPGSEKTLRAGEFLQSSTPAPGGQYVTESDSEPSTEQVDPLKDLEPVAASVPERPPSPLPDEPRGLEWYLKTRAGVMRSSAAPAAAPSPAPPAPEKPELIGFDQTPSPTQKVAPPEPTDREREENSKKAEDRLFAYMDGEGREEEKQAKPRFRLPKGPIIAALFLAGCGIVAAPQAPWHSQMKGVWKHGQKTLHAWLNPQPVTTPQAPVSHENFGRPGDEYKLPVAENIPDATTDPSQIQVVPVIDPTAKKTNNTGASPDQPTGPSDGSTATPVDPSPQPPVAQVIESQPAVSTSTPAQPPASPTTVATPSIVPAQTTSSPQPAPHSEMPTVVVPSAPPSKQPIPKTSQPRDPMTSPQVPSSLKSQMVSMTPEASGNKPLEAALPSIEPVQVPEATERGLLEDQPAISYPATAKGQHGTVVLQVLIGRDGTVHDAKFLQGSLAFARTAIDGIRQWRFRPYVMNGRPVSVQTTMTLSFRPISQP